MFAPLYRDTDTGQESIDVVGLPVDNEMFVKILYCAFANC